jgi:hypothetical protein
MMGGSGKLKKAAVVGAIAVGAMGLGGAVARNPNVTADAKTDVCNAIGGFAENACEQSIDIDIQSTNDAGGGGPVQP